VSSTVSSVNAARSDPNLYTIGYADSADAAVSSQHFAPGTVVIKPVLVGDANLDGIVNFSDFQLLASGFNGINTTWDQGDFNYAKKTNFTDFQLLASNFNNSKSLDSAEFDVMNQFSLNNGYRMTPNSDGVGFTLTAVPEPASMALIAVFGLLGLQRRRGPRICCK
jgi:hypothetical protein